MDAGRAARSCCTRCPGGPGAKPPWKRRPGCSMPSASRPGSRGNQSGQPGRAVVRPARNWRAPGGKHVRRPWCATSRCCAAGHREHQYRSDRRAAGPDRGELARVARQQRCALGVAARLGLHAGGGRRQPARLGDPAGRQALRRVRCARRRSRSPTSTKTRWRTWRAWHCALRDLQFRAAGR